MCVSLLRRVATVDVRGDKYRSSLRPLGLAIAYKGVVVPRPPLPLFLFIHLIPPSSCSLYHL